MPHMHHLSFEALRGTDMIAPIMFKRVSDRASAEDGDVAALLAAGGALLVGTLRLEDPTDGTRAARGFADAVRNCAPFVDHAAGSGAYVDGETGDVYMRRQFGEGVTALCKQDVNVLRIAGLRTEGLDAGTVDVTFTGRGPDMSRVLRLATGRDFAWGAKAAGQGIVTLMRRELVTLVVEAVDVAGRTHAAITRGHLNDKLTPTGVAAVIGRLARAETEADAA